MLLKRKIVTPIVEIPPGEALPQKTAKLNKLMEFQKELSSNDPKHSWGILREWFEKLFNEFPNPDVHHQMIMLRIQYELVRLDYEEQKIPIPERLRQNICASKLYEIEKLAPSLRGIMESLTKGENMATTKSAVKTNNRIAIGKTIPSTRPILQKTETVAQSYVRLFQENFTKKLTDVQLATEMIRLHPNKKKYTIKDIETVRGMFNRGIKGFAKPKVALLEIPNASSKNKK